MKNAFYICSHVICENCNVLVELPMTFVYDGIITKKIIEHTLGKKRAYNNLYNPKTGGEVNLTPCGFSKIVSSKERVKPWFFVTFTIILRHTFPENFIEFSQVVQKIWRNSQSILGNFLQFSSIIWIFWHYLVTKKPMMSGYNRWCQHFFTFNIL